MKANEPEAGRPQVPGWGRIIATLVGVALVVGVVLGFLGAALGLPPGATTGGVGASVGIVGALLVARRRAAINGEKR